MSKTRVYEYAKKYNLSSKDVITKLKEMNIEVSNHMATIEDGDVVKLDAIFNKKESAGQKVKQGKSTITAINLKIHKNLRYNRKLQSKLT